MQAAVTKVPTSIDANSLSFTALKQKLGLNDTQSVVYSITTNVFPLASDAIAFLLFAGLLPAALRHGLPRDMDCMLSTQLMQFWLKYKTFMFANAVIDNPEENEATFNFMIAALTAL